jgi:hypothetical protein
MERVVYILGAGFSAPLGLPVVRNFRLKSQDQFASAKPEYEYFGEVFKEIQRLSVTKNFFNADLYDVEEILSLIEMSAFADAAATRTEFVNYIADVIRYHTPNIGYSSSEQRSFGLHGTLQWQPYIAFVIALLGGSVASIGGATAHPRLVVSADSQAAAQYAVVSLNYDTVLETAQSYIHRQGFFHSNDALRLNVVPGARRPSGILLAKLHGTIDQPESIVPPTWSKANNPATADAWKYAHEALGAANHIRFIGYSLPAGDANVRYLLKSALSRSANLKSIDVICLDDSEGSAERRYREFVSFNYFRFKAHNTSAYLGEFLTRVCHPDNIHVYRPDWTRGLEESHDRMMSSA